MFVGCGGRRGSWGSEDLPRAPPGEEVWRPFQPPGASGGPDPQPWPYRLAGWDDGVGGCTGRKVKVRTAVP